jgi:hypothetical protein
MVAAMKYRLHDVAELMWRPIDAILASRKLSNLTVSIPIIVVIVAVVHHDGTYGLVSAGGSLIAFGGVLYGIILPGRRWRGVKPAEHKPSGARK